MITQRLHLLPLCFCKYKYSNCSATTERAAGVQVLLALFVWLPHLAISPWLKHVMRWWSVIRQVMCRESIQVAGQFSLSSPLTETSPAGFPHRSLSHSSLSSSLSGLSPTSWASAEPPLCCLLTDFSPRHLPEIPLQLTLLPPHNDSCNVFL